jgi:hypothetical protein
MSDDDDDDSSPDSAPPESAAGPLPTLAEAKADVVKPNLAENIAGQPPRRIYLDSNFRSFIGKRSAESERSYAHLKGLKDHYWHKAYWSWFLSGIMGFMVFFQSVLLCCVGLGWWDFSKYKWLLPVLLAQNLAQIVGLAVFVVKALFKDLKID